MAEPAKSTSRHLNAISSPLAEAREGGGEVDRGVLVGACGAHERHDLLGREDVDLGPHGGARLLDVGDRVGRQAVELACSFHGAVEDRDRLFAGAVGEPAVGIDLDRRPTLDALGGEILESDVAEVRQNVVAEDRLVVAERGWLPLPVLLDVVQVLGTSVCDRGAGAHHAWQRSGGRLGENRAEPGLGRALREGTGGWSTARGPRGPDRLLHLAAVGQPVLGAPDRPALALVAEDVTRDAAHRHS
jgi:hypothetical protein